MFKRNREKEAGPAIIEHEFGSALVREHLSITDTKDIYRVDVLEVVLPSGDSYDLISNEMPENTTLMADFRDEPTYKSPVAVRDKGVDNPSIVWYPKVFRRSVPEKKEDKKLVLRQEEHERFTRVGDIAAIMHEFSHVRVERKMERKAIGEKDSYGMEGEPLETPEDVRRFIVHVLRNELDVWIEAFRRERQLRDQDIIIEPDIEKNKERVDVAMESIATHAFRLFRERKRNRSGAGTAVSERIFLEQWAVMLDGEGRELRKSILAQIRAYPK